MNEQQAGRTKFDSLFTDPRHYRGDCRLLRTAVRRGWLDNAPQADRDALVARFLKGSEECEAAGFASELQEIRAVLKKVWAMLEMTGSDQRAEHRALRYCWAGKWTGRTTGRPRERDHVSDFPHRIDANELRRQAEADGQDIWTLQAIDVRRAGSPGGASERVAVSVVDDARYGSRVWLICPRCKRRRTHLYWLVAGIRCRECGGIGYRRDKGIRETCRESRKASLAQADQGPPGPPSGHPSQDRRKPGFQCETDSPKSASQVPPVRREDVATGRTCRDIE